MEGHSLHSYLLSEAYRIRSLKCPNGPKSDFTQVFSAEAFTKQEKFNLNPLIQAYALLSDINQLGYE